MTRRCLECDHHFCLSQPVPSSRGSPKGKKRKRIRGGPCRAEFDYAGWSIYNSWRRTVLLNPSPSTSPASHFSPLKNNKNNNNYGSERIKRKERWGDKYVAREAGNPSAREPFKDRRDGLFVRKRHNCWLHCNFPSECRHAIYNAKQEGWPVLEAAEALDAVSNATAAAAVTEGEEVVDKRAVTKRANSRVERPVEYLCSPEPPRDLMYEPDISPVTPTSREVKEPLPDGNKVVGSNMEWADVDLNDTLNKATPLEFEIYADDTATAPTTHLTEAEVTELNAEPGHRQQEAAKNAIQSKRTVLLAAQPIVPLQPSTFALFVNPQDRQQHGSSNAGNDIGEDDELESAYSERPWYTTTTATTTTTTRDKYGRVSDDHDFSSCRRSSERKGSRDDMVALFGRRTITTSLDGNTTHGYASAERQIVESGACEDWESWPDSSCSSTSSSSASSLFSSGSSGDETGIEGGGKKIGGGRDDSVVTISDVDDDTPIPDATPLSPIGEKEDADTALSPAKPVKEEKDVGELDLMSLLRMRNAFMRGTS